MHAHTCIFSLIYVQINVCMYKWMYMYIYVLCCVRATIIAVTPLDGPNKYHSYYDSAPASIKRIFFTAINMFLGKLNWLQKEYIAQAEGWGFVLSSSLSEIFGWSKRTCLHKNQFCCIALTRIALAFDYTALPQNIWIRVERIKIPWKLSHHNYQFSAS